MLVAMISCVGTMLKGALSSVLAAFRRTSMFRGWPSKNDYFSAQSSTKIKTVIRTATLNAGLPHIISGHQLALHARALC